MKKTIMLILTLIISMVSFSFHMSPDDFGKRFDNGDGHQEYTFKNETGKTIRYRFEVLPGRNPETSMHEWIEFEPKNMTIKNGESKKLKVFAKAPEGTPEGGYSFYLAANSVTVPQEVEGKEDTVSAGATIGINMNVEMLGWVGDLPAKLKLEFHKITEEDGKVKLQGFVKNTTEKRYVNYIIEVIGKRGQRETLIGGVLTAGKDHEFEVVLPQFAKKNEIWKIEVMEAQSRNLLHSITL